MEEVVEGLGERVHRMDMALERSSLALAARYALLVARRRAREARGCAGEAGGCAGGRQREEMGGAPARGGDARGGPGRWPPGRGGQQEVTLERCSDDGASVVSECGVPPVHRLQTLSGNGSPSGTSNPLCVGLEGSGDHAGAEGGGEGFETRVCS